MIHVFHLSMVVWIQQHVIMTHQPTQQMVRVHMRRHIMTVNDVCLNDSDGDGVCDELEIPGCTDSTMLNYDSSATDDNGS